MATPEIMIRSNPEAQITPLEKFQADIGSACKSAQGKTAFSAKLETILRIESLYSCAFYSLPTQREKVQSVAREALNAFCDDGLKTALTVAFLGGKKESARACGMLAALGVLTEKNVEKGYGMYPPAYGELAGQPILSPEQVSDFYSRMREICGIATEGGEARNRIAPRPSHQNPASKEFRVNAAPAGGRNPQPVAQKK